MARYAYEWKDTEHGKRLFRRPSRKAREAAAAAAAETPALSSLKKDELIELADARGVDATGTKADIIERLESDDGD